jgi:CheY-like chemotaxis protein
VPPPDPIAELPILVVDDQPANVMLLERVLAGGGHSEVLGTTDPTAVAELCREFAPALMLLDLHMPGMDGFEVMTGLQEVLYNGHGPTVVMLTADESCWSAWRWPPNTATTRPGPTPSGWAGPPA